MREYVIAYSHVKVFFNRKLGIHEVDINAVPLLYAPEIKCKEFGTFHGVMCAKCGYNMGGKRWGIDPCPKCGSLKVKPKTEGNPHAHGNWVFELHLDEEIESKLCKLLGIRYDPPIDVELYSCYHSWHNFRPDSSGFDICHVNCLDKLIDARINQNLKGDNLFMHVFPKEGKVKQLYARGKVIRYWENGEYKPLSVYFAKYHPKKHVPVRRGT